MVSLLDAEFDRFLVDFVAVDDVVTVVVAVSDTIDTVVESVVAVVVVKGSNIDFADARRGRVGVV